MREGINAIREIANAVFDLLEFLIVRVALLALLIAGACALIRGHL
jgi:hypothetical protein